MISLRIAFDLDDVIVNTAQPTVDAYKRVYGEFDSYGNQIGLSACYTNDPALWGLDDMAEASRRIYGLYLSEKSVYDAAPSAEAKAVIGRLADQHTLYVITGRSASMQAITDTLINSHFKGIFRDVVLTNHHLGTLSKSEVCKQLGIQVLVDDLPHHIVRAVEDVPLLEAIQFGAYPWSGDSLPIARVIRASSWTEVEAAIERIATEKGAV